LVEQILFVCLFVCVCRGGGGGVIVGFCISPIWGGGGVELATFPILGDSVKNTIPPGLSSEPKNGNFIKKTAAFQKIIKIKNEKNEKKKRKKMKKMKKSKKKK
jgi:hypothetical protein